MKHLLLSAAALLLYSCSCCVVRAQGAGSPAPGVSAGEGTQFAPVKVEGRKLFDVMGGSGLSASERADRINRRLSSLIAGSGPIGSFDRRNIISGAKETTITLSGVSVLSVSDADAQDTLSTRDELSLLWGQKIATAVTEARATHSNPLAGAGILIRNSFSDLILSVLQWLPRLAGAVALLIVFILIAKFNRWAVKLVFARAEFDSNVRQLLRALVFYGTWLIGMLSILSTLGLDGGSIATTLGISGFVLGFAFKDILSHFFAGLMLLLGRQFHIGDQIQVKDFEGTVERIELRALYLRTYDNRLIIIPNGDVFTSAVTSNTASPHRRSEFIVGIGYDDDIDAAQDIALRTIRSVEGVAQDPAPDVLVHELAASTVNLQIRFYASSKRADYLRVGSECMRRVKQAFDREHISMPTDIQTIVIQNVDQLGEALARTVPTRSTGAGANPTVPPIVNDAG